MATLTVRNVPDHVMEALKDLARRNGRSMEREALRLVESIALDREAACEMIEEAWQRQRRPTRAREVRQWIVQSRV